MSDPARPGFHFTVPEGWINDPHGIRWQDGPGGGRYHLFFQYNPDGPEWAVACRWGRSTAPDLVRWGAPDVALAPAPGEAGCWTGSVVVADDGAPVIVYTSVRADSLDRGAVVLAPGDRAWQTFTADVGAPVLTGPPTGLGVTVFRDPHVERDGDGWRMVVGGGTADRRGLALLYRSPDLRAWSFEGVLAERPADALDPVGTGAAWECVQLFPLDGRWALVLSAWDNGDTLRVVAAVGDFDGRRFTAAAWQRLGATDVPYATTTFLDAAGRRCAMSWAREGGPVTRAWAGALSLPWVLGVRGDRLVVRPHPDVGTLRTGLLAAFDGPGGTEPLPPALDVELTSDLAPGATVDLDLVGDAGPLLGVRLRSTTARLRTPDGNATVLLGPGPDGVATLRLVVDAGLAEVFTAAGDAAVLRLPPSGPVRVVVRAEGPAEPPPVRVAVFGMPAPAG